MTPGKRLEGAREKQGLTRLALAKLVGCHPATITHWEDGSRIPKHKNAVALASALGIAPEWLMSGTGPEVPQAPAMSLPLGMAALDEVRRTYDWPTGVASELAAAIERELVTEANSLGADWSPSVWRLRIREKLRKHESGRHKLARVSGRK